MKYHIFYIVIILLLIVYLVFGDNGLLKYREMARIKNSYEVQADSLVKRTKVLEKELKLLKKDKDYFEMIIRRELNLKKPDEDLYILNDENTKRNRDNKKNKKSD